MKTTPNFGSNKYGVPPSYSNQFRIIIYEIESHGWSRARYEFDQDTRSWVYLKPANSRCNFTYSLIDSLDIAKEVALINAADSFKYCKFDIKQAYPELFI